jgi:PAS domain-containing protein
MSSRPELRPSSVDDLSRRLLDAVLNNIDSIIYVKDTEGRYLLVNDRFCSFFGRARL